MKNRLGLILSGAGAAALLLLAALWLCGGGQAAKIEMAANVPAETLVYLEANDLPQVLRALTTTDAWRDLAAAYKVEKDFGSLSWISRMLAAVNFGSTENIVYNRAQIAVALMNLDAADAGENLKIKLQYAVVIETRSSRVNDFVQQQIGEFARRQFGEVRIETSARNGASWTIFHAATDARDLFAAVSGTTAIVGNSEAAVQACLDARDGIRKSLKDDGGLQQMRVQSDSAAAFAFGFVTTAGVKQLSNVGAIFAAGQMAEDKRAISFLADALPPFVQKSVTTIGWTARAGSGKIEDRYFVNLPPDLVSGLREPLAARQTPSAAAAALLPADVQTVTTYNLQNPAAAWRGSALALTTRMDAISAAAFASAAGGLLTPYGIEKSTDFLNQTSGEIVTARITADDAVAVVKVKDAAAIKQTLAVDSGKQSEFANDYLLLGKPEDLAAIKAAREQKQTLETQKYWQDFADQNSMLANAFLRTLTRDAASPERFVKIFSARKNDEDVALPGGDLSPAWFWFTSETRLAREGFERRTISPFGLIGYLATNLRKNNLHKIAENLLTPASRLFGGIAAARRKFYANGVFKTIDLGVPVVSVGNLTMGGTGKTPLVAFVARILAENNHHTVCVLTRGYKRRSPRERVMVSDGAKILASAAQAGDEPFELAQKLLGTAAVIADKNRAAAGVWALENLGATAFVLDDGFQHLRLKRDLDVVTIDAINPFGNGKLLPAGILREPLTSLRRADCVVITRADLAAEIQNLKLEIQNYTDCPILISRTEIIGLREIKSETKNLTNLIHSSLITHHSSFAFCALGNPQNFFDSLKRANAKVRAVKTFPDHHFYSQNDADKIEREARKQNAEILLTTAKDAVKLQNLKFNLPCYAVEIEVVFEDDAPLRAKVGTTCVSGWNKQKWQVTSEE